MLIGISGTISSGKAEVVRYLTFQGFEIIQLASSSFSISTKAKNFDVHKLFETIDELVDFVTLNWRRNFVISHMDNPDLVDILHKRPFFLQVLVDAPIKMRYERFVASGASCTLEEFIKLDDDLLYYGKTPLIQIIHQAHVDIVNTSASVRDLYVKLLELNLLDKERLRPTWDLYFMRLADLAALRSNCMKRRVGAVIVRLLRVVATGYNGTPRHLTNCNEGGCDRCNKGPGLGAGLSTCLCLHAEENALLEAGRDRIGEDLVLYCNTCPCLTCSIKIVQSGIKEVVYAQSYLMDEATHRVMKEAKVVLRQFQPPRDELFV